jgi:glycosyltransferase involved in cell wall biosynthesis
MKVSIVTVAFNAAGTIDETIRSVLAQESVDFEYIVIDGGSADGTAAIIERYAPKLSWWVSEPDRGQADALNKGFARASGDVLGFLNADDLLLPGALRGVAQAFEREPHADLVYGEVEWIDVAGASTGFHAGNISSLDEVLDIYCVWWEQRQWVQPEVFFRRALKDRVGAFDARYHLAFDFDFWVRCFRQGARVSRLPQRLAKFRRHPGQKSSAAAAAADEIRAIVRRHLDDGAQPTPSLRRRLEAQLSYDAYQSGRTAAGGFFGAFLRHPQWVFSPEARARARAACAKLLRSARTSG